MNEHVIELKFQEYFMIMKDSFARVKTKLDEICRINLEVSAKYRQYYDDMNSFVRWVHLTFVSYDYSDHAQVASQRGQSAIKDVEEKLRILEMQSTTDPHKKVLIPIEDYVKLCDRTYFNYMVKKPWEFNEH